MLRTTSKKALIDSALMMSRGDISKAREIIELYTNYLDLPDTDPIQPTAMEQIKTTATDVFGWVRDNKDDILGTIDYLRSFNKPSASNALPNNNNNPIPKL